MFRFIKCNSIIKTIKHQKILNILNQAGDYKFVTRKKNIVNDGSNANYSLENEIFYSIETLKSNLCDYNDAYIFVTGDITIIGCNLATQVTFKKVRHSFSVLQKLIKHQQMVLEI